MNDASLLHYLTSPHYSGKDKCWALKQLERRGYSYDQVMSLIGR